MKISLAQINPTVGDLAGNATRMQKELQSAAADAANLVVFPELSICGYPPKDLLLQESFVARCEAEVRRIGESSTADITAIFGCPLPAHNLAGTTNSLLVYQNNHLIARYDKRLLPTYDVFDEDRYFVPGSTPTIIEISGIKVGLAICEDLWKGEDAGFAPRYADAADPVTELVRAGARIIAVSSASPFVLGKGARHREILRKHATRHSVHVLSVNQVGGNDELIFDGHACAIGPGGELRAAAKSFDEDRVNVEINLEINVESNAASSTTQPSTPDPLLSAVAEELLFRALVLGVKDYCRKTGFRTALIGLSGGIDSALTACIAAAALGSKQVTGVSMPGEYSSQGSKFDAYELAKRLGMECQVILINPVMHAFRDTLDAHFEAHKLATLGANMPDITEENLQSRIRGNLLMALSNRTGSIVLTTGNKSEMAVGYCTLYGDMSGGLAVLADVTKQQVYKLSRWINANPAACGFTKPPIPDASITKPPSAELRPGQTDQDSLPPYEILDEIIARFVESRQAPSTIVRETGFDAAVVTRIVRMIDLAEYKRKQAPIGLKVTSVAFGSGRRVPIAQGWRGE